MSVKATRLVPCFDDVTTRHSLFADFLGKHLMLTRERDWSPVLMTSPHDILFSRISWVNTSVCARWPLYRLTLEKEAELELMRSKKRQERDYFKKMETGELQPRDEEKKPKLLIGKIKDVSRPIEFKELCSLLSVVKVSYFFSIFSRQKQIIFSSQCRFQNFRELIISIYNLLLSN